MASLARAWDLGGARHSMDVELIEIRDFLGGIAPFSLLPQAELDDLTRSIEIRYARKGSDIMLPGDRAAFLYVVRSGAIETRSPEGELLGRQCEGECFGVRALLKGEIAVNQSRTIEDSLLYQIPAKRFEALRRAYPKVERFFAPSVGGSLAEAARVTGDKTELNLMTQRIGDMVGRGPVTIGPEATVRAAAARMRDNRVSCVLITADGSGSGDLVGIFTDRDIRNRVVAEDLALDTPLHAVMSPRPIAIEASDTAFDALLLMSRHVIRHLPVTRKGALIGCVTTTNLIKVQTASPVYLVGDIHKQADATGLRAVLAHVPDLVHQMAEAGASADSIGRIVSALTDAATVRLLRLAEEALGPPPVPYAWIATGSQGRQEQTARSDQDNGLVLDDTFDPDQHGAYFAALAKRVCDGLATCGYVYCPGEMMAMTDRWRQPLARWKEVFRRWIEEPEPRALMLSSIFFDLRCIHGSRALVDDLQAMILDKTRKNHIFLAYMAGNALTHQPPIGFFRNLVLIRGGENDSTLDMKHTGVVPIIDLARVYALSVGVRAVNTRDRLEEAEAAGAISSSGARNLRDALEFVSLLRLRHQARRIRAGEEADNFLPPQDLSSFERNHLKDAFGVVKTMQAAMANTYQTGRF